MGTTRIKVIDLSSEKQEIATSRKHAEKLAGFGKIKAKKEKKAEEGKEDLAEKQVKKPSEEQFQETPSLPVEEVSTTVAETAKYEKAQGRHHAGAKWKKAVSLVDKNKIYPKDEAIDLLYKTSFVQFDPTVEVHINVIDKKVQGNVNFPHSIGATHEKRILVFSDKKLTEGENIILADDKTIDALLAGNLRPGRDFDLVVAEAKFMPQLARVAKILGPRGMMPNPKNQTVTDDVLKFIASQKQEEGTEFKTDLTAPIVHMKLGKLSNKPSAISENFKALILGIGVGKIKKAVMTSTMGPGIKVDVASFL